MKINLKKSLTLFIGTIIIVIFVSSTLGENFISNDNVESVSNLSIPSDVYAMYPELIKKIDAMPDSFDLIELGKLEAEYGVDLTINFENKRFLGVMVNYENVKEYSIGIIFGLLVSFLFFLKYLSSRNIIESQDEKLGSNFLIYLNLYITVPIIIFVLHVLDMQQGWTSSGVFIPIGLVLGSFLSAILLFATIGYFIRTAKNSMSIWSLFLRILEPFLWIAILLIIYPIYFEFLQYL